MLGELSACLQFVEQFSGRWKGGEGLMTKGQEEKEEDRRWRV